MDTFAVEQPDPAVVARRGRHVPLVPAPPPAPVAPKVQRRSNDDYRVVFDGCVPAFDFAQRWECALLHEDFFFRELDALVTENKDYVIPGMLFARLWGHMAPDKFQTVLQTRTWVVVMCGVNGDTPLIQKNNAMQTMREDNIIAPFLRKFPEAARERWGRVATVVDALYNAFLRGDGDLYRRASAYLKLQFEKAPSYNAVDIVDIPNLPDLHDLPEREFTKLVETNDGVGVFDFDARWAHFENPKHEILQTVEKLAQQHKPHEIPSTLFSRLWGADADAAFRTVVYTPSCALFYDDNKVQKTHETRRLREDAIMLPFLRKILSSGVAQKARDAVQALVAAFEARKGYEYSKSSAELRTAFEHATMAAVAAVRSTKKRKTDGVPKRMRISANMYADMFTDRHHAFDFEARWAVPGIRDAIVHTPVGRIPAMLFDRLWGVSADDAFRVIVRGPRWIVYADSPTTNVRSQTLKRFREDDIILAFLRAIPASWPAIPAIVELVDAFTRKENKLYKDASAHLETEFDKIPLYSDIARV